MPHFSQSNMYMCILHRYNIYLNSSVIAADAAATAADAVAAAAAAGQ